MSEAELVDRLRAGEATARTTVVRRYHSALVHHARRVLRDRDLAEDVVQEAWLAAFARIDGFNPRCSLFAWLVAIVINRARGLRRRELRSLPFSVWASRAFGAAGDEEPRFPTFACNDCSPERLLLEREALRRFIEALQALPEGQRSALLLRDLAGASSAEACRVLRINDLTLRVRLCRARASIRKAVSGVARGPLSAVDGATGQRREDVSPTRFPWRLKVIRRLSGEGVGLASAMTS